MAMTACDPNAKAVSGTSVEVKIEPLVVSSGFMQVAFTTNKEAYYHIGILPKEEAPDTTKSSSVRAFMARMLDIAYANYIFWRYDILETDAPFVADFATHSLQYGNVDYTFTLLKPGTDYFIYAFVVDPKTNKPDGMLTMKYVTTEQTSLFSDMQFEYRVRGFWDYIYPVNPQGTVLPYAPWCGVTRDSAELVQSLQELEPEYHYASAQDYFLDLFNDYMNFELNERVHFGIYVHWNNGIGDGTSNTMFEQGHTYYTALVLMDGYLLQDALAIYKFRWGGEDTQLFYTKDQRMTTPW